MSALGDVLDAITTVALTVGITVSHAARLAQDLEADELPHLLIGERRLARREVDYLITIATRELEADLITRSGTQAEAYTLLDSLRAAIAADRTLGGVVDTCTIASEEAREDTAARDRLQPITINTEAAE